eukprot:Hpha_TRINITY_DN16545_c8_g1::TRINITY_DN16545_c8_g1_i1::g.133167::m.133167
MRQVRNAVLAVAIAASRAAGQLNVTALDNFGAGGGGCTPVSTSVSGNSVASWGVTSNGSGVVISAYQPSPNGVHQCDSSGVCEVNAISTLLGSLSASCVMAVDLHRDPVGGNLYLSCLNSLWVCPEGGNCVMRASPCLGQGLIGLGGAPGGGVLASCNQAGAVHLCEPSEGGLSCAQVPTVDADCDQAIFGAVALPPENGGGGIIACGTKLYGCEAYNTSGFLGCSEIPKPAGCDNPSSFALHEGDLLIGCRDDAYQRCTLPTAPPTPA